MIDKEDLLMALKNHTSLAEGFFIDPGELVFEEAVKMNCFYCGRYNNNWRCPPNLPEIDYKQMMREFDAGMFVVMSYDIKNVSEYEIIRNESSVVLHRTLLELEKYMWNHNSATAISFIGGSCKLCKGGCGKEKCNNPYMSRSPIEATGVNVVKSARKCGIDVNFPPDKKLVRIGLLLWQEAEG